MQGTEAAGATSKMEEAPVFCNPVTEVHPATWVMFLWVEQVSHLSFLLPAPPVLHQVGSFVPPYAPAMVVCFTTGPKAMEPNI